MLIQVKAGAPPVIAPPPELGELLAGARPWWLSHGNCVAPVIGLEALPDDAVDHAFLDPPYSRHVHTKGRRGGHPADGGPKANHRLRFRHLDPITRNAVARQLARVVRRWIVIFTDEESGYLWIRSLRHAGLEHVRWGTWVKTCTTPQMTGDRPAQGTEALIIAHRPGAKRWNGGGKVALWECPIVQDRGQGRHHETEKPLELLEALVRDFTDKGDLILDAFAGSGTTGVAALRLGRRFLGWERAAKHVRTARRRLAGAREQLELVEAPPLVVPAPALASAPRGRRQLSLDVPLRLPPSEAMHGAGDALGGEDGPPTPSAAVLDAQLQEATP